MTRRALARWPSLLVAAGALSLAAAGALAAPPGPAAVSTAQSDAPFQRGVALGLFSEDAGWSYRPLLDEIAATGADHVELVVPWYLTDVHATEVHDHPRFTPPRATVERAVADAHAAGLRVLLFPILRLERQANPDEWRGTLAPRAPDGSDGRARLFASYGRALADLARLAERHGVAWLSVGSELSTLDGARDHAAWATLVASVRGVYRGHLTYSGNWDHYDQVAIYDLVDAAGLCAYFSLTDAAPSATVSDEGLVTRWRTLRATLESFARNVERPLLLTEVGYLSQRGAAAWPWNEGATEPVDLEEQRRAYAAFRTAWTMPVGIPPSLTGAYFWNWYGWGGATSGGYTPRGKPAVDEMRRFFRAAVQPASVAATR